MSVKHNLAFSDALLAHQVFCSTRPLHFVMTSFAWGEGDLSKHTGPDDWQIGILRQVEEGTLTLNEACRVAVASGHGIGKSALVAWLILWAICTMEDARGVVTANTENQLRTKTWAELAKWHRLCIFRYQFTLTATAMYSAIESHERTWRIDMIPWSLANTDAFAGLHNEGKRLLLVFDEASAIPDLIWEVSEGALTDRDTEIFWLAFGNPTRNTGRFKECFGRFAHRWSTRQIDSRSVKISNKEQIAQWIEDYGEDSDFVRVRVRGVFPRVGNNQFIGDDLVQLCREYEAEGYEGSAKLLGVDVARFGDDQTVMCLRQGRKVWPLKKYRKLDTMATADRVAEMIRQESPDYVLIDGVGVGGGVVDRLKQLGHGQKVIEVNAGAKAQDEALYFNLRAEMWGVMRAALAARLDLPEDNDLFSDLIGPEYSFTAKQQLQLEKKQDMKKRGLSSPDCADALAMTYAQGDTLEKPEAYNPLANLGDCRRPSAMCS